MTDTGDVCFCFTDIEASTRLLRRLGEAAYDELIEQHRALVRAALARTDGEEVRAEGDGFFLAFPTASAALRFAIDAQRMLAAEPWPAAAEVRVRMGLHAGPAERRADGDYMALAVHQAARVTAAAHGGQVLLTEGVAAAAGVPSSALTGGDTPTDAAAGGAGDDRAEDGRATFVSLGRYRLRDFDTPVELLQLTGLGVPSSFPPVRAAREHVGLPIPRTATVGREREVDDLVGLVSSYSLVSLVGPGGIGKTRLAVEVALAVAAEFADGVHLVELSNLPDPGLVPAAVVTAVGLRPSPGQSSLDGLLALLANERRLLVLDSCEGCLDAAAQLTDAVLAACPGVVVLATTTEPLRLPGERVVPVAPLPLPAVDGPSEAVVASGSVRLLVDRAAAAGADPADLRKNVDDLATVARRLDGIPLALELAAGRIAELGLTAVVAALDDRFSLLTNGYRTGLARHQTLEAAVAWTVGLLDDGQRGALERLSVLAGRWPVAEAAAVAGLGDDGASLIQGLAERALVAIEGELPRVRMLDTIRAFATAHRHAVLVQSIEEARDISILDRMLQVRESTEDEVLDEFGALVPDILAACDPNRPGGDPRRATRIQTAAASYFELRGLWSEGRQRLQAVIAACPPGPERLLALAALANLEQLLGNQAVAAELARQLLDDPDTPPHARSLGLMVAFPPGVPAPDGFDPYGQAIELATGLSSLVMAAQARAALTKMAAGDAAGAVPGLEALIAESERRGRWSIAAQTHGSLGGALAMLGDDDRAEQELRRAEELGRARSALGVVGAALSNRALLAFRQGRLDDALDLAEQRIELARKMDDVRGEAPALNIVSNVAMARGDLALAKWAGERTHELYQRLGQLDGVAVASFNLVTMAEREGDLAEAGRWLAAAIEPARVGSPVAVALALYAAGAVAAKVGDAAALELMAAAATHAPGTLPLDPADHEWIAAAEQTAEAAAGRPAADERRVAGAAMSVPEALASVRRLATELTAPAD